MLQLRDAEGSKQVLAEGRTLDGLRLDRAKRMAYALEEVSRLVPSGRADHYRWTEGKFQRLGTVETRNGQGTN